MALTASGAPVDLVDGVWRVTATRQRVIDHGDTTGHVLGTNEPVFGLVASGITGTVSIELPVSEINAVGTVGTEPVVPAPPLSGMGFPVPVFRQRVMRGRARIRVGVHARGRAWLLRDATPRTHPVRIAIRSRGTAVLESDVLAARQDDEELILLGVL